MPKDACSLIKEQYRKKDTFYVFNHVDLKISYHSGRNTDWGTQLNPESGRIICKYLNYVCNLKEGC